MRTDLLELLARRAAFMEQLAAGPRTTRTLVAELPCSRTTVNRGLRELQDVGLVERTENGYGTTTTGDLAWKSFRRHERELDAALDAADLLDALPDADGLPPAVVAGASETAFVPDDLPATPLVGWLAAPDEELLAAVDDLPADAPVTLLLAPAVLDESCREAASTLVDVASRPETTILAGPTPAFSLLVGAAPEELAAEPGAFVDPGVPAGSTGVEPDDGPSPVVVVHDADGVRGALEPADVAWALSAAGERLAGAPAVDEVLAAHAGAAPAALRVRLRDAAPAAFDDDPPLPDVLARQGFERLTASYFQREPEPPAAALRSGFEPVEVSHGYAIERRVDEGSLTETLLDRLSTGEDFVLVGPPGAGKSTTCMRVAVEWFERDHGPVLYRSAGAGTAVEDSELLSAYLRALDGHPLVVAEDAPRPEVRTVLETVADCGDRADVSVLLDAREREWRDLLPVAGADAVTELSMPSLDRSAAERLVDRVESLTEVDVEADPGELLDAVADRADESDGPAPGAMYLLKHWLSLRADDAATATPDSALTADVERVHDVAADGPRLATDVAVLVNLLGLAGLAVRRELVYALAFAVQEPSDASGGSVDDTAATDGSGADPALDEDGTDPAVGGNAPAPAVDEPVAAAEAALDALAGECLFGPVGTAEPARFRTPHETWSTAFLAALSDREGADAARRRFGRVVSATLSLADDDARRERVADVLGSRGPHLVRLATDVTGWADDAVKAVFAVPTDRGQLAPLYGHSDDSHIDLPAACSPAMELRVAAFRGRAYDQRGDADAASREFEWLRDHASEAPDATTRERLLAEAERQLGARARTRGDLDRAEELLSSSLDRYRDLDEPTHEGNVERVLGVISAMRREFEDAERHFEAALEIHREDGTRAGLASAYNDRGLLAKQRGDLDVARDCLSAARDLLADLGETRAEAVATMNLGLIAMERNDHQRSRRLLTRALRLHREVGNEDGVVSVLTNLGSAALETMDLDDAAMRFERALTKSRELGDSDGEMAALRNLGEVARRRGRFEEAADRFAAARDAVDGADDRPGLTMMRARLARDRGDDETAAELFDSVTDAYPGRAPRNLAELARRRGDLDDAETRLARALDHLEDSDEPDEHALTLVASARVAMDRGDPGEAAAALDRASEHCDPDDPVRRPDVVVATARGRLHHRRGDDEAAADLLEPAATTARDAGAVLLALRAIDVLVEALAALDRSDDAVEWCNAAAEMAADAGLAGRERAFRDRADDLAG